MVQIRVLSPQDRIMKSFTENIVEPILLRKGDGVIFMSPQGHKKMYWPPEHALNPHPDKPDHPLFSWDPHTGALLDGGMHPIDGAATHLQAFLDKNNIKNENGEPMDASEILQRAIDRFNLDHVHTKNHGLADFDSPEWRKAVVGPHPINQGSQNAIGTRGNDGLKFTYYSSKPGHEAGLFPESGAIPMNKQIQSELNAIAPGLGDMAAGELEFVKYPNISPELLSPNTYRTKAGELQAQGIVPSHVLERHGPEGLMADQAYGGIHTWETVKHLPDDMFHIPATQYSARKNKEAAEAEINQVMMQMEQAGMHDQIPDTPISLADGRQISLREAMPNPELRAAVIHELAKAPVMQYMFAGAGSPATATKTRKIMHPIMDVEGIDLHAGHARTGTRKKGRSPHSFAAKVAEAAGAYGPSEKDPTRSAMADVETDFVANLSDEDRMKIANNRTVFESIASMMAIGYGHNPDWVPDWDNLPTSAHVGSKLVDQIINTEVTPHWKNRFHTELSMAPMTTEEMPIPPGGPGPATRDPEPQPLAPRPTHRPTAPLAQPAAKPTPATVAITPARKPVVSPRVPMQAALEGRGPPGPPPGGVLPADLPRAPSGPVAADPRVQALRTQVGQADPRDQRALAEELGVAPAITQDPRALRHFADPQQTFLDQWVRTSLDQHDMLDRIEKAMEEMQLQNAKTDVDVLKYVPRKTNLNLNVESDVALMANKTGLTKHDIRSLAISKGDWHRVAEVFNVPPPVVGAVKVVFS